jgi:hypothetical protein
VRKTNLKNMKNTCVFYDFTEIFLDVVGNLSISIFSSLFYDKLEFLSIFSALSAFCVDINEAPFVSVTWIVEIFGLNNGSCGNPIIFN